MNVLITSISNKVPLIKCVKSSIGKSLLYGADSNTECIGKYFVDKFWHCPKWDQISPHEFLAFCQSKSINKVIPTRDGELLFFAKNRDLFLENGLHVMISDEGSVAIALDKLKFSQNNFAIKTSLSVDDIDSETIVVKERFGAGSESIGLNLTKDQAICFSKKLKDPIFQPFIKGNEISADLYVTKKGKCHGIILRKRLVVVRGESQVTETFTDPKLEDLLAKWTEKFNFFGHIMFQLIVNDQIHIIECNPRFGGASTLSVHAGLDSFHWFFLEASNNDLDDHPFKRCENSLKLIRYPEDLIL